MAEQTANFGLTKDASTDYYNIDTVNTNLDKIDKALGNTAKFETASGTGTAIILNGIDFVAGYSKTFVVSENNNGAATKINGKPLYKPGTTTAPKLIAGRAATVWYDLAGDCFFIKASAEGDAIAEHVLAGKTFSNDDDTGIVGTMPDNGAISDNITSQNGEYTIPKGYHNGLGKIKAVISGLVASVIKAGTTVGGITGTFTSDANAAAGDMLSGKTAYVKGAKVTGNIPSKGAQTYTPSTSNQTIASGQYLSGDQTIKGDANLVAGNIRAGVSIFGVSGNSNVVNTSGGDAVAGNILAGKKAYVAGSLITGTMTNNGAVNSTLPINGSYTIPAGYHNGSGKVTQSIPTQGAQTITPGTSDKTIPSGRYLTGTQTIKGDANLIPANILAGKSIFGVAGSVIAGKRFASGAVNMTTERKSFKPWGTNNSPASMNYLAVSGLTFKPSVILAFKLITGYYRFSIYIGALDAVITGHWNNSGGETPIARAYAVNYFSGAYTYEGYVNNTGFLIPNYGSGSEYTYDWYAWE